MEIPYKIAFLIPLALVLLCLVKKLTVIGIIGNTHGVKRAAKPEKKAMINIDHRPRWGVVFEVSESEDIDDS